jgi:hypothetical protein
MLPLTYVYAALTSVYAALASVYAALASVYADLTSVYAAPTSVYAAPTSVYAAITSVYAALASVYAALASVYAALTPLLCPCRVLKVIYNSGVCFCFRKADSDEEQRKRQLVESVEDAFEDAPFIKRARLDLPMVRIL